jgi:DNA repair protein RecO (recombination protein O)
VVLRTVRYGDTSLIVTLYTRELGKLAAIAKGARRKNNPFGSALQPMSAVSAVLYVREGREVQTLAQCDLEGRLRMLREDVDAMAAGMTIVELVDAVTHAEHNHAIFDALTNALRSLDQETVPPPNVLYTFELQLAEASGFGAGFERCSACGKPYRETGGSVLFDLSKGSIVCRKCAGSAHGFIRLSGEAVGALRRLLRASEAGAYDGIPIAGAARGEIESFLRTYFHRHIPGMRALRSEGVFAKILGLADETK